MKLEHRIAQSVGFIREHARSRPKIGIILGSGLGDFADSLPAAHTISTSDIPHYPVSTVEGHKGKLVFAALGATPILAFQGRVHFYESNNLEPVLYPVRVAHELGIRTLIITNAAGGINRTFQPGDLMVITDQINLTLLRGFFELARHRQQEAIYSPRLVDMAEEAAARSGIPLRKGVYAGLRGPSYETAAEIEMLTRIGADAVGMSTVFEAWLASALEMEVLGISCITNLSTGITSAKLSHSEVTEVGNRVKEKFARLLVATITMIAETADTTRG